MIVANLNNKRTRRIFCGIVIFVGIISIFSWHLVVGQQKWLITSWSVVKETNRTRLLANSKLLRYEFNRDLNVENIFESKNILQNKEWKPFSKKVLIISRGRSGSSFLGDLFNQNNKVFYLFEPLGWAARERGHNAAKFKILNDIYDCRFTNEIYLNFLLKERGHRRKSKKLSTFPGQCSKLSNSPELCLYMILKSSCFSSNVTVAKVLTHRLPHGGLWGIRKILDADKSLRIVHLIRDPRRVIASMKKVGWFKNKDFTQQVKYVCHIVWANIKHVQNESMYYKDRYKLVVFSDLMLDPFSTVKELYDFLELGPVPANIFSWIKKNTMMKVKGKSGTYQTTRNSTEVLTRKVKFPKFEEMVIDKYCEDVINFIHTTKSISRKLLNYS
ncbi:carbohydrate sulfotransferase 3-like [Dendronephthya gigantea]|uniref:carbohydrate sulfotransferase 3-like n=1 Tax=Dendronephthya gigantea TaxID=151771 RepID=UPI00106AE8D0|nr:carbohydrate sulfotransferase 3-like [Dendronephthya gigantea]XP_028407677.1 carbohydrate sulfotransferase 3-like [Dendronephthya gigantea]XP_028407678.1 carbohydrate sulfotransferase 3-like [Dendronephthya gigantea]XP_028407679.1 carbohydrate sulfotransferase 3-like [Dendronephthya gigantea]